MENAKSYQDYKAAYAPEAYLENLLLDEWLQLDKTLEVMAIIETNLYIQLASQLLFWIILVLGYFANLEYWFLLAIVASLVMDGSKARLKAVKKSL